MIREYKSCPIAYTLDVGVNSNNTFIIEVHDFFSCGLYGFSDNKILPYMFSDWFDECVKNSRYQAKAAYKDRYGIVNDSQYPDFESEI